MTPERWRRIKDVLDRALNRPPGERAALLDRECGSDIALRRELDLLLSADEQMGTFLERTLVSDVSPPVAEDDIPPELHAWTRYYIIERLGSGGMAVVYKAWDPRLQRLVAIKVMSGHDDLTIKRFVREAEAQARVDHEYVLKVYETGTVGSRHYIAMQYVNGPMLLDVRHETTVEHKVDLMLKIAEGLHAAHRQGLVHRDIKPSNILVERTGEGLKPYLLDFGLAIDIGAEALTKTGILLGTPRYMAPERVRGGTAVLDRRSDIYGLGATFYEVFSGRAPFASANGLEVLVDVLQGQLTPLRGVEPTLSPEIEAIVAKCLEHDPQQRYASARALAEDLRRYLDGDPVLAKPSGRFDRLIKRAQKHPRVAAAFAVLTLTTLAVAAWGGYGYWRATHQAELAQRLGQEVRDIEWLYRAAQMSPLHGIEPERQHVRGRMARLSETMAQAGAIAVGPGQFALGRGLLALGDPAQALPHLERAWNAGYRTPDAATAMGLAYGEIFRLELAKAHRIEADRARSNRIAELERTHRDRALGYLEEGRASTVAPGRYVDALIASLRDDLAGAVQRADEAARETPWLFEARLLPARLEFNEAVRLYLKGDLREAGVLAFQADRHYGQAERIAESSIDAYVGRCAVAGLILHMAQHGLAADSSAVFQQAEESCGRALVVDPAHAEAHRLFSDAVRSWGTNNVLAGRSPGTAYERAADLVARALALSGEELEALLALADTLIDSAWWQNKSGGNPTPALNRAVEVYEKALAIDPRNVTGANNMGQALLLRSRFERAHDLDASESQDRAITSFERTLEIDPALAVGFKNLLRAAIDRANEQARRGRDPQPGLERVIRFIETLPGDRAHPDRVDALKALRARLEATR